MKHAHAHTHTLYFVQRVEKRGSCDSYIENVKFVILILKSRSRMLSRSVIWLSCKKKNDKGFFFKREEREKPEEEGEGGKLIFDLYLTPYGHFYIIIELNIC